MSVCRIIPGFDKAVEPGKESVQHTPLTSGRMLSGRLSGRLSSARPDGGQFSARHYTPRGTLRDLKTDGPLPLDAVEA